MWTSEVLSDPFANMTEKDGRNQKVRPLKVSTKYKIITTFQPIVQNISYFTISSHMPVTFLGREMFLNGSKFFGTPLS